MCVSREVEEISRKELTGALGIDRNLRNLAVGDAASVKFYDMREVVRIGENTRSIVHSFKRLDMRTKRAILSKYGKRRRNRTQRLLHLVSKQVVRDAKASRRAIVFEEISGIRKLYKR